ncbi:MAG: UDP-glycosyltransferase [Burkholderiaceae bacterium]|nr:UDP-glycosyltransferase [Burkholderiaceae bacterium]
MAHARRVLFVTYGAGHIAMVLPVIRALREREPGIHIDLLALTTAAHEARRQGFEPLGYRDFAHWYDAGALQRHAAPHLAGTQHPLIDEAETIAYLGINFEDLHQRLGPDAAAREYAQKGRWAFMPLNFMRRLLRHLKPDVVVATNSPRSEEAALTAAAELGIPGVCMVDLFSPAGDPFLDRTQFADALTTISELGKRNLIAGGVPAERIHITGSPAFDSLADPLRAEEAAQDRAALGWQALKVILWAGNMEALLPEAGPESNPAWFPLQVERILRDYVRTHADTALVIRYHPNQVQHFDPGPPEPRVLWSVPLERRPHRDILLADLVVVNGSTMGLEAAVAGKSVLAMDNSPGWHIFPLSELGVARGVAGFADLAGAVDAALREPFTSEFARLKGAAAGRVADVIERVSLS